VRINLVKEYPDIISKIKIVALTDEIPNGPVAISKDLPLDVKAKIIAAIKEFSKTPEGRDALLGLYDITGLADGRDTDYDGVRKVIKDLGKTVEEVVPGGVSFYMSRFESWMEY
jgi:phosphonate transport system substrate-binding protein